MQTKVKEIEVEVVSETQENPHDLARILAWILDDLIPVPGTKYRVGLDPILGLIPGLGDTSTAAFGSVILIRAMQAGVPRVVLARMAANLLLNALIGAIPGLGDLFSAWFKSNRRNYHLLQKHSGAGGRRASTAGDWAFLIVLLAGVFVAVLTIALAAGYLAWRMLGVLFGGL